MGRKKQRVVVGHRYRLGTHTVVGYAHMDGLERVRVGEKVAWTPTVQHPDNVTSDQHIVTPTNTAYWNEHASNQIVAQLFTVSVPTYPANLVQLKLYRNTFYTSNTYVQILKVDGYGMPDQNNVLATSADVAASSIGVGSGNSSWVSFSFSSQFFLEEGVKYAIAVRIADIDLYWETTINGSYSGGNLVIGTIGLTSWSPYASNPSVDALFKIYLAEGSSPNHQISINNRNLFGGDRKEGGVHGKLDLLFGTSTQGRNSYLQTQCDSNIPAFRGVTSIVGRQVLMGTSPYVKPWSYLWRRIYKQTNGDTQWYPEKAHINIGSGNDLNAIHVIRECLIDKEWGAGFETTDIDSTSFEKAADICYDEDFGISLVWDNTETIEDFIGNILGMIAGFLYQDLSTGKWVISLTREYDLAVEEAYTATSDADVNIDSVNWNAQIFQVAGSYEIISIKLPLYRLAATSPGLVTLHLRNVSGTPQSAVPIGADILSIVLDGNDFITDTAGYWYEFKLTTPLKVVGGSYYAMVLSCEAAGGTFALQWLVDDGDGSYANGNSAASNDSGSTWGATTTRDNLFEVYGRQIDTFGKSEISEIEQFSRPAYGEIVNQVTVMWWDKYNNKERPATVVDLALIEKQNNNVISSTLNHFGICNAALANTVAERELNLHTAMLASMRIRANRTMSHLKPNDVFRLTWPDLDITQMYVRVIDVNYGNLSKNEIMLSCIEDVFATAATIYADPQDTEWTDPVSDAADVSNQMQVEIPYWILINEIENESVINALDDDSGFMLLAVRAPSNDAFDFEYLIQHEAGLGFNSEGVATWCPSASIADDIYMEAGNLTVDLENTFALDFVDDGSYAIINGEIVQVVSVDTDNDQITIARGLFDTVPVAHSSGDYIYFIGMNYVEVETEYTDGDTPQVKYLSRTGNGSLDEDDATTYTASAMNSRFIRPYPPGNLTFNTESYPTYVSTAAHSSKWTIAWAHRDRTHATQKGTMVLHTDATDYGPETGATVTIKIYDEDDNLIKTATGESGTSYEYTEAQEISDAGSLQAQLRFEIYCVRGGYDSFLIYDITIKRSLVGTCDATSTLTGDLRGCHLKLAGTCAATSSVSSAGLNFVLLAGSSGSTSGATGAFTVSSTFAGTSDATSSATGTLAVATELKGTSAAMGGATGALSISGAAATLKDHFNDGDSGSIIYEAKPDANRGEGQSFTATSSYDCSSVKLKLSCESEATGITLTVRIFATDGSGLPTGSALATGTITGAAIPIGDGNVDWIECTFASSCTIINSTKYAILLTSDEAADNTSIWLQVSDGKANGNRLYSNSPPDTGWGNVATHDVGFETWGT